MKVAFVGHSYHRVTGSSRFFLDLLASGHQVTTFWDDSWHQGGELDVTPIVSGTFDAVVVWQCEKVAARLAGAGLPNVTFFPMYDSSHAFPDAFWAGLKRIKVVCFSSTLHERLQRLGLRSRYLQYFPDPGGLPPVDHATGLIGYFWQRQQEITWRTIRPLLGEATFLRFTLNRTVDPSLGQFVEPSTEEVARFGVRYADWQPDKRAALAALAAHNVYFAPRMREGIGMSFLEAMAMGFLVVAPDRPTMNEYILPGVNGLLYDPDQPGPLDFSRAVELGAAARRTAEVGHARWRRSIGALVDFVSEPAATVPLRAPFDSFDPWSSAASIREPAIPAPIGRESAGQRREGGRRLASPANVPSGATPRVTVAVVTRNAEATLRTTLESILRQDFPSKELVVLDGASVDGTLEIIREYDHAIDLWHSAPDDGPYEAMNAAAKAATGTYVVFMNAGDVFQASNSLSLALDSAPSDADVIYGHHVYRHVDGHEELHRAAPFERTWAQLREGRVGWTWLSGVPGHQATLTRAELLRRHPFRTELRIAADHDLLYRLAAQGARFHHSGQVLATYVGGGLSWKNQGRCFAEWHRIALEHSAHPIEVEGHFARMGEQFHRQHLAQMSVRDLLRSAVRDGAARRVLWQLLRQRLLRLVPRPLRPPRRLHVEFGQVHLGADVRSHAGLGVSEGWGRWTDGGRALIDLATEVRRPARVSLRIQHVFGPNVGKPLVVRIGSRTFQHILREGEQTFSVRFGRSDREPVSRLELEIPEPASPRQMGYGNDDRHLGVALCSLEVEARP